MWGGPTWCHRVAGGRLRTGWCGLCQYPVYYRVVGGRLETDWSETLTHRSYMNAVAMVNESHCLPWIPRSCRNGVCVFAWSWMCFEWSVGGLKLGVSVTKSGLRSYRHYLYYCFYRWRVWDNNSARAARASSQNPVTIRWGVAKNSLYLFVTEAQLWRNLGPHIYNLPLPPVSLSANERFVTVEERQRGNLTTITLPSIQVTWFSIVYSYSGADPERQV